MDVRFVLPEIRRLDELKSEALAMSFFADERPLRGALGLVDWRLRGQLSRLAERGRLSGMLGEITLVAPRPRLPFEKLFLFGLGATSDFDSPRYDSVIARMFDTLAGAHVRACVCCLPGRSTGAIDAGKAIEQLLTSATRYPEHDEITIIEPADAQAIMRPVVERERRRARAASL